MNMNDDLFPFFNAWKNHKELKISVSTVLPQQPQHSIFPSKIHHTNCHVAVAEKMGDIKSIPKLFSVFPKKSCIPHTQILKSCSNTVLVVDEKKAKVLKMKQLENTFFLQFVFLPFGWGDFWFWGLPGKDLRSWSSSLNLKCSYLNVLDVLLILSTQGFQSTSTIKNFPT